ncbi:palmitoyltransferase ZDHHC11 [Schistosoma japonicum]|nr:palmitoyltransferase ZDHHC11 [Schistosoma japonicum]
MSSNTESSSRINGWSLPVHPLQCLSWFATVMFSIVYFGILINVICIAAYVVFNVVAVSINPADTAVREKQKLRGTKVSSLDPKHSHVIEKTFTAICFLRLTTNIHVSAYLDLAPEQSTVKVVTNVLPILITTANGLIIV